MVLFLTLFKRPVTGNVRSGQCPVLHMVWWMSGVVNVCCRQCPILQFYTWCGGYPDRQTEEKWVILVIGWQAWGEIFCWLTSRPLQHRKNPVCSVFGHCCPVVLTKWMLSLINSRVNGVVTICLKYGRTSALKKKYLKCFQVHQLTKSFNMYRRFNCAG